MFSRREYLAFSPNVNCGASSGMSICIEYPRILSSRIGSIHEEVSILILSPGENHLPASLSHPAFSVTLYVPSLCMSF